MNFPKVHGIWDKPTIFHITQYKCGSQWVAEILKWCAYGRVVLPQEESNHLSSTKLLPGFIYPTCYISKAKFDKILSANQHIQYHKKFLVIRDPRDICVSMYFSMRNSHDGVFSGVKRLREFLKKNESIDGLTRIVEEEMPKIIEGFSSWLETDIKVFRFEDLTQNPQQELANLLGYLEIEVSREQFELVLENNSFKALSGGRSRGSENASHHYRKGVQGDWRNHFTDELHELFLKKFENQIVALGYDV
jgi:lipopolysaccharide transport system ATP-binding protein